ncbi:hypothetical protein [Kitasatospora viridis]|uniref:Uncharacterized protein n=1 Tax=Kitasatospora viridis TaxID=281105 RepID=A0A561TSQ7_9ACTN|nr:hypothetical protein [Kitasatospora viridis]TWF90120.1 hypothetical protein FHX73_13164 [Kitasatospora viridis]
MDHVDTSVVTAWSRAVVREVAPGEMPLFKDLSGAFFAGGLSSSGERDALLGFGVDTGDVLVTAAALQMCTQVWQTVTQKTGEAVWAGAAALARRLRRRLTGAGGTAGPGEAADPAPEFTVAELRLIRTAALERSDQLGLPDAQCQLLADAIVGALAAPVALDPPPPPVEGAGD